MERNCVSIGIYRMYDIYVMYISWFQLRLLCLVIPSDHVQNTEPPLLSDESSLDNFCVKVNENHTSFTIISSSELNSTCCGGEFPGRLIGAAGV